MESDSDGSHCSSDKIGASIHTFHGLKTPERLQLPILEVHRPLVLTNDQLYIFVMFYFHWVSFVPYVCV